MESIKPDSPGFNGSASDRVERNYQNPSQERPTTSGGYSSNSGLNTKSSKRKKKKNAQAFSLEEVFNEVSNVVSSNLNAPIGHVLLTPRSAEVCLKLGVNPEILKVRDIDSFWEPGVDPAVQRMRHEAYVQRRHETMKQCRTERKRIINEAFEASTNLSPGEEILTPEMLLEKQKEQSSTLIQLEMQRIEKLQRRQQKELEQMIQFELNRTKVQQEMEQRVEEEKKRQQMQTKQAEKRAKLAAEERRLKELQKAAVEEMEEETRRAVARQMHEEQVRLAEEKAHQAALMKKRAQDLEMERKEKQEEHKREVQKFFNDEQIRLRKRMENLQYAEKKKQEQLMKRQEEHAEIMRERREKASKRIEQNVRTAEMIEEKRKNDLMTKQQQFEESRQTHLQRMEQERSLQAQELQLQEQRRRMIMMQQRKEEERIAEALLQKFDEEEENVQMAQELRNRELDLMKEKKNLRTQIKYENVERVMRQNEYKKTVVLKKIENTDSRIKNMLNLRMTLIEERRRAAAATRLQKEKIAQMMEEVRTNATKATKVISAALSGKLPLEELISPASRSPSNEAAKRKKNKATRSKSTSELMGLNRGANGHDNGMKMSGDADNSDPIGTGAMARMNVSQPINGTGTGTGSTGFGNSADPLGAANSSMFVKDEDEMSPPKPYISPYEQNLLPLAT